MTEALRFGPTRALISIGLAASTLGLGAVLIGSRIDARQAGLSYLAAYAYGVSLSVGALALVMIGHVTGASWFVAMRRPVEAVAGILPVYALLFLPIVLLLPSIYSWASPELLDRHAAELVERKRGFLNPTFFLARSALYLAVWSALGVLLWRRSVRHDASPVAVAGSEPRALCAVCLPAFALTLTFAAFDWLMALDPTWSSSIYGIYYSAGALRSAIALAVVLVALWQRRGLLPAEIGPSHYHALGRLLLTLVLFWAYVAFSQGLIVWIADLPVESSWYLARTRGGWGQVLAFLGLGGFAIPFLALLSRDLKRHRRALSLVAVWLLGVQYVDVYWLVLPAGHADGPRPHWLDGAALLGVGGTAVAATALLLRGTQTVPRGDSALDASLRYVTP